MRLAAFAMTPLSVTIVEEETGRIAVLEVTSEMELETFKALLEVDFGVAPESQFLYKGNSRLSQSATTLAAAGIQHDDMITLKPLTKPDTTTTNGQQAATGFDFSQLDFSQIDVANAASKAADSNPPNGTLASSGDSAASRISSEAARQAERILLLTKGNPKLLAELTAQDPLLGDAAKGGDRPAIVQLLKERLEEAEVERKKMERVMRNPMSVEAQELMLDNVRQKNIDQSLMLAQEYLPESFASVIMLYVRLEINSKPIIAFVDSGAQTTIMSKRCAEQCSLRRLVDSRFQGIAQGVGTSKICGRVHVVQIKMGTKFFPASITIIDDDKVDFLFGLDLLRRYQCLIDLKRDVLQIEDELLPFLSEREVRETGTAMGISTLDPAHSATNGATNRNAQDSSEESLKSSNVNPNEVTMLLELGFSEEEARAALSTTENVDAAVALLIQKSSSK